MIISTIIIYALALLFGALGGFTAAVAGAARMEGGESNAAVIVPTWMSACLIGIALLLAALPAWL